MMKRRELKVSTKKSEYIQSIEFFTLDIIGKKWYDSVNGNTYFSCQIVLDNYMSTEESFIIPFQSGYGDAFIDKAIEFLIEKGYIKLESLEKFITLYDLRKCGVIVRTFEKHVKKRDMYK